MDHPIDSREIRLYRIRFTNPMFNFHKRSLITRAMRAIRINLNAYVIKELINEGSSIWNRQQVHKLGNIAIG